MTGNNMPGEFSAPANRVPAARLLALAALTVLSSVPSSSAATERKHPDLAQRHQDLARSVASKTVTESVAGLTDRGNKAENGAMAEYWRVVRRCGLDPQWCPIDRGAGNTFLDSDDIDYSAALGPIEEPIAGTFCGLDRDEEVFEESGIRNYTTGYYCSMHTTVKPFDRVDDPRITMLESGAIIWDREEELPGNEGDLGR